MKKVTTLTTESSIIKFKSLIAAISFVCGGNSIKHEHFRTLSGLQANLRAPGTRPTPHPISMDFPILSRGNVQANQHIQTIHTSYGGQKYSNFFRKMAGITYFLMQYGGNRPFFSIFAAFYRMIHPKESALFPKLRGSHLVRSVIVYEQPEHQVITITQENEL